VLSALHAADAYLQGSAFEGFGIGLLEGMAAGKPFVAFDAGAARDLSARGAGVCVRSEEEMAQTLASLPDRLDTMGSVARSVATEYSLDRMVQSTIAIYRSITAST